MTKIKNYSLLLLASGLLLFSGCKKDDKPAPPTVATLITTAVTNITATSATSGGTITGDGGAAITASGIAWSKTNNMPTIAEDTTKGTTASGSFVSELTNLDPSATYYVRAYATNSVGTGYGNVLTFGSGNAAPEARNVNITGDKEVAAVLTANYTYFDAESNTESATAFQWYIANDTIGAAVTPVSGATANTYTPVNADTTKFIKVGITPKSSAGTSPGIEAKSYWVGPIGAESVTFTYNGQSVTYGVITSSITGRKWMDRNLGAQRAATSYHDYLAYGDLFQWGRPADGHQLLTRINAQGDVSSKSGTTTTQSTTDLPGHALFYANATIFPPDWRNPSNDNLWQAASGQVNNPCPSGWHIPTRAEWDAEIAGAEPVMDVLKLTPAGRREGANGGLYTGGPYDDNTGKAGSGNYWSSTPVTNGGGYKMSASFILFTTISETIMNDLYFQDINWRYHGYSVRCIKD